jgi:hypothetical protein
VAPAAEQRQDLPVPDYLAQQRAALGEVPVLAGDSGAIGRSVEKSFSLRAVNSLVDHALAFAVAVNAPVVSGWLAVPATLAYSTVFVLNDRLWEAHWAQRRPQAAARAVEFVHLGVPA